jgi:hypothetical protein
MTDTIKLACHCGKVAGELKHVHTDSFHVKCLCCDCQEFASQIGQHESILDAHGGTELFQTYPAYVTITQGADYISQLRLTPKGLLRYYTSCCNTPIGNMMSAQKVPFIGIPVAFMQFGSDQEKDKILGPIIMQAFAKYAKNAKPEGAYDRFPLSFLPKLLGFMAKGFLQKKYLPSPYRKDKNAV